MMERALQRKEQLDEENLHHDFSDDMLVLRYNNRFDNVKGHKLEYKWEGPFRIHKLYPNGSCRLQNMDSSLHNTRVNVWRLKPYHLRTPLNTDPTPMPNDIEGLAQVLTEDDPINNFPSLWFHEGRCMNASPI